MSQQRKLALLLVLIAAAAAAWFWSSRQTPQAAGPSTLISGYTPMNVDNPAIPWWKINRVQGTEYKSSGRNPFSDVPPPPPPAAVLKPGDKGYTPPPPPPPPPPPELPPNMKFFGYGTVPNGTAKRAFLSDGDEVYIVAEGDTLLGRYRVTKIGNATLEFVEISSGRQGRPANLEDAGPTG
jgi:hypothetical protein